MRLDARLRRPTATLFVQILTLVAISLVVAQAINIWVIFHLPRPTPLFYTASDIAHALKKGPTDGPGDDPRALIVTRLQSPSSREFKESDGFRYLRGELAGQFGVQPDDIFLSIERRAFDDLSVRQVRDRLESTGRREAPFLLAPFRVAVRQADGHWLVAGPPKLTFFNPWQSRIILWFLITTVAMAPVIWLFARRLSSSVAIFATAAERLGRAPDGPPLALKCPSEIAPAVAAFNEMQSRLQRYVADRTAMTAAMAHDLRTPLTRLRFRVESAPAAVRAKMAADIDEMEAMISSALAYVRDARGGTERTPLEVSSLLESVIDDLAETGANVTIDRADRVVLSGDPMGLRRLLTNLVENACKFGGGARSRLYAANDSAIIEVEDDGPGIPDADLEKVFEPFYRGEPSRSRKTGGSGLGLATVRSIAQLHGGDVTLTNRAGGGLLAQVKLPL